MSLEHWWMLNVSVCLSCGCISYVDTAGVQYNDLANSWQALNWRNVFSALSILLSCWNLLLMSQTPRCFNLGQSHARCWERQPPNSFDIDRGNSVDGIQQVYHRLNVLQNTMNPGYLLFVWNARRAAVQRNCLSCCSFHRKSSHVRSFVITCLSIHWLNATSLFLYLYWILAWKGIYYCLVVSPRSPSSGCAQ